MIHDLSLRQRLDQKMSEAAITSFNKLEQCANHEYPKTDRSLQTVGCPKSNPEPRKLKDRINAPATIRYHSLM